MASRRTLSVAVGAAFVGWLAWGVIEAGGDAVPPPMQAPVSIQGGHAEGHRLTMPSWSIDYDAMQSSADGVLIQASGVRKAIIYRDGKPYVYIRAQRVEANLASHDFSASGDVHASQTVHGVTRTFDSQQANWTEATHTLNMPTRITLGANGSKLNVRDLHLDTKSGNMRLGRIEGDLHM